MHIVTIDDFLLCCSLEVGGYMIGYVGAILTSLGLISLIGLMAFLVFAFEEIKNAVTLELDENTKLLQSLLEDSPMSKLEKLSILPR